MRGYVGEAFKVLEGGGRSFVLVGYDLGDVGWCLAIGVILKRRIWWLRGYVADGGCCSCVLLHACGSVPPRSVLLLSAAYAFSAA
jgi:hypothetical protein